MFAPNKSGFDRNNEKKTYDDPPHSRLFIIHKGDDLNEDDFRDNFEQYGTIQQIHSVGDKRTGKKKGVTYIKFSLASEAATAMEEMNGKRMGDSKKALKILVAHSSREGARHDDDDADDQRLTRLFVTVGRNMTDGELQTEFSQYGELDHAHCVKDKSNNKNKGYGFVRFKKPSCAAIALENCDKKYRAIFAQPKSEVQDKNGGPPHMMGGDRPAIGYDRPPMGGDRPPIGRAPPYMGREPRQVGRDLSGRLEQWHDASHDLDHEPLGRLGRLASPPLLRNIPHETFESTQIVAAPSKENTATNVVINTQITDEQLWRLFDMFPGLDYWERVRKVGPNRVMVTAYYYSKDEAEFAVQKLNGFEYPPGERLEARLDAPMSGGDGVRGDVHTRLPTLDSYTSITHTQMYSHNHDNPWKREKRY